MSTVPKGRIWLALGVALVVPSLSAMAYFVWLKDAASAQPTYAATKVFLLAWPLLATLLLFRRPLRPAPAPLERHLRAVPLGLAIGLPIAGVMALWMATPLATVIDAGAVAVREKVIALGFLESFIPFALYVTFVHSLLEEYYWRWFVYGNLRDLVPRPAAHAIAAVGFSLHHIVVTAQFFPLGWALFFSACVGVGGLIWSVLYQRQGTLAGAWASHAVVDAALMILGYHLLTS